MDGHIVATNVLICTHFTSQLAGLGRVLLAGTASPSAGFLSSWRLDLSSQSSVSVPAAGTGLQAAALWFSAVSVGVGGLLLFSLPPQALLLGSPEGRPRGAPREVYRGLGRRSAGGVGCAGVVAAGVGGCVFNAELVAGGVFRQQQNQALCHVLDKQDQAAPLCRQTRAALLRPTQTLGTRGD